MCNDFLKLHRGDVVIVDLGDGDNTQTHLFTKKRPAILLSNEMALRHSPILNIACLSTNVSEAKRRLPIRIFITANECGLSKDCTAACEQIISIDRYKIKRRVGSLNPAVMKKIDDAVRIQLAL